MLKKLTFDRLVIIILIIILVLISVLLLVGDRVGVRVSYLYPQDETPISIRSRIGLSFDEPMLPLTVEERFTTIPELYGTFSWEDSQTLWFVPVELLDPEVDYSVTISAGAEAESGRKLINNFSWEISVRQPDIVYMVIADFGGELWRYQVDTGSTFALTQTNNRVYDFAVDFTGQWIAFAQFNDLNGSDLWLIDRNGIDPTMIIDCQQDRCSQPAWSPNGEWLAYSREEFSQEDDLHQPARVWSLYTPTGETNRLYDHPDAFGHSPTFSPDGLRLASYQSNLSAIRILILATGEESVIPSVLLGVGDWSPDGKQMLYTDLVPSVLEPNVGVYIANLETQQVDHAFGEFIPDTDFSPPRWSPDGQWVAFGARPVGGGISKRIWIINLSTDETIPVTDDPTATYTNYRWHPTGEKLVFQRFPISGPNQHASLWIWDHMSGTTRMLVENGARPEWLP